MKIVKKKPAYGWSVVGRKLNLKFLSEPLAFLIVGIIIGAALVYVYYNINSSGSIQGDSNLAEAAAYLKFKELRASVTPSGVPEIYGNELRVSFDEVQEGINILKQYDPAYGFQKIVLIDKDLQRYIDIASRTSCQYCCGVKALIEKDGEAACGCAHSWAMRGLTAYLIQNHGSQYSDEEILEEANRWKAVFFPKQTLTAKLQELQKAGEPGIKEILEEFPEFMPSMVGGC